MTSTQTKELEEGFLSTARKSQEIMLEALQTWVDTIQAFIPKVPSVRIPYADRLPKPEDVVANAYDFAEKLLAGQRKFAEDMVKALAPAEDGKVKAAK